MNAARLFDLSGRTALVTGSSRGIGLALAEGLAGAGAVVILNGRHADAVEEAAAGLRAEGAEVLVSVFDVADEAAVEAALEQIEQQAGPLDIVVNNAGINVRAPLTDLETDGWDAVLGVNVKGAMFVARAAARRMIPRHRGKIINTCSLLSERALAGCVSYGVSKAGIKALTKVLAVELAPHNIQVNGLGPGYYATELTRPLKENPEFDQWVRQRTPAGRWGELHELAGAAIFLASDASSFVTGQILYVDGGWLAAI